MSISFWTSVAIAVLIGVAIGWGLKSSATRGKSDAGRIRYSLEELKIFGATKRILPPVLAGAGIGLLAIGLWSYGTVADDNWKHLTTYLGLDLLVALAAASAGGLFGFLFAIPRTVDLESRAAVATAATQAGSPSQVTQAALAANTNLERVSDWLVTLLIGATLVQIKDIASWIGQLGAEIAETGGAIANKVVFPVVIIYFFTLTFLSVYLITRLYLTFAFSQTLSLLAGGRLDQGGELRSKERDQPAAKQ